MDTESDSGREAKKGAGKQRRVTFFDLLAASEGAHSKILEDATELRNRLLFDVWMSEYGGWEEFLSAHQHRPPGEADNSANDGGTAGEQER